MHPAHIRLLGPPRLHRGGHLIHAPQQLAEVGPS